jgi:ATP-dependent RNA helicase RhlE
MSFNELGLSAELVRAVADKGYTTPTPVQLEAIPAILAGEDLLAGAQTGTGKTAGFTLPILQRLTVRPNHGSHRPRALILTPTRELAAQVHESVRDYGRHLPIKSTEIYGGVSINPQIKNLRNGVDVIVATPGRLLDHAQQRTVDLSRIEVLVLDEADRMLDMGFIRDIRRIMKLLPAKRQNLLFSATFSKEIRELSNQFLHNPRQIQVTPENTPVDLITQRAILVDRVRKPELLAEIVKDGDWHQVLVFTRTKHVANKLTKYLNEHDVTAAAIHGNKSQAARTKALADFKANEVRVLVATDIAARGLDIVELPHVVNFELPNIAEDYVHRIGRTGRAGREGEAVSLVCVDERKLMWGIEKLLGREIEKQVLPGFEPDPRAVPMPIQNGRNARGGGGRGNNGGGNARRGRPSGKSGSPKSPGGGRGRNGAANRAGSPAGRGKRRASASR